MGFVELFVLLLIALGIVAVIVAILRLSRRPLGGATHRRDEGGRFPTSEIGVTLVEVINPVGTVEVRGEAVSEITYQVQIVGEGESPEAAFDLAVNTRLRQAIAGDRLVLHVEQRTGEVTGNGSVQVHWAISVPAHLEVRVDNSVGRVSLAALTGMADIHLSTGDLRAIDCSFQAPSTLHTSTGNIHWEGRLGSTTGRYEVSSSVGNVAVALPAEAAFSLEGRANLGRFETTFPDVEADGSVVGGRASAIVNGGGPTLSLSAATGNVSLNPLDTAS